MVRYDLCHNRTPMPYRECIPWARIVKYLRGIEGMSVEGYYLRESESRKLWNLSRNIRGQLIKVEVR